MGGYFIVNGIERIIRLLVAQRRHYVMGMVRGAYARRGPAFTEFATAVRCVAADESSQTVRVHYLSTGGARVAFVLRRQEFFVPTALVLRALVGCSDREVIDRVVAGRGDACFAAERVEAMLRETTAPGLHTRAACVAHLGRHFRPVMDAPASSSDTEVGEQLLAEVVFVHLPHAADKFALLVLMLQKLYALVAGECQGDNPDSMTHHEALLPGHLLQALVKERLQEWLARLREVVLKETAARPATDWGDVAVAGRAVTRSAQLAAVCPRVEYLLSTGNLVSRSGLGVSQATGFTLVAEKVRVWVKATRRRAIHASTALPPHHQHTTAQLPALSVPLPLRSPRRLLPGAAHHHRAQAAAGLVGLHVPGAHARRWVADNGC